jgi:hypothetical protein
MSSINTKTFINILLNNAFIKHIKVAKALVNPNGITKNL